MSETAHHDAHLGVGGYLKVAVVLAIITAVEIVIILPDVKVWYGANAAWFVPLVVPVLVILSVVKFFGVVLYFMHLKQDRGITRTVFFAPLGLAFLMIAVLFLFYSIFHPLAAA